MHAAILSPSISPVISNIIQQHPACLGFTLAGVILGKTPQASYVARARGQFPVRVRRHGGRLVVFTSDLVAYIESGLSQADQSAPPIRKTKAGRATQTKTESLEPTKPRRERRTKAVEETAATAYRGRKLCAQQRIAGE